MPKVMAKHQYNRKRHSIATNPNQFSPAHASMAFVFASEVLANRSAEYPRCSLTPEVFESFYTRHVNTYGHEHILDNWYRRADYLHGHLPNFLISTSQ
jgi:hypothetical protein